MKHGVVVNVAPGKSVVRLDAGGVIVAWNALNNRTPPKSRVVVTETERGWVLVGRIRS